MRGLVLVGIVALLPGCGSPTGGSPSPVPEPRSADEGSAEPPATALPEDLPERLEIEGRRRSPTGDDRVLKLTPAGARLGLAHGKARVALRYQPAQDALASTYAALRREGFDRLRMVAGSIPAAGGTSIRVTTGDQTHAASAMGRQVPDDAQAYARCLAALEEHVPAGRSAVVVEVRWDASMRDRSAGIDVDAGSDLVGLHRASDEPGPAMGTIELHLARARPLELQLRQGGPAGRSTVATVHAGMERGVELAFDEASGEVVMRPLGGEAAAAVPSP